MDRATLKHVIGQHEMFAEKYRHQHNEDMVLAHEGWIAKYREQLAALDEAERKVPRREDDDGPPMMSEDMDWTIQAVNLESEHTSYFEGRLEPHRDIESDADGFWIEVTTDPNEAPDDCLTAGQYVDRHSREDMVCEGDVGFSISITPCDWDEYRSEMGNLLPPQPNPEGVITPTNDHTMDLLEDIHSMIIHGGNPLKMATRAKRILERLIATLRRQEESNE